MEIIFSQQPGLPLLIKVRSSNFCSPSTAAASLQDKTQKSHQSQVAWLNIFLAKIIWVQRKRHNGTLSLQRATGSDNYKMGPIRGKR